LPGFDLADVDRELFVLALVGDAFFFAVCFRGMAVFMLIAVSTSDKLRLRQVGRDVLDALAIKCGSAAGFHPAPSAILFLSSSEKPIHPINERITIQLCEGRLLP